MKPDIRVLLSFLLAASLPFQTSCCKARDGPLLLSPYLDNNQSEQARSLSRVERDCVEDFVPDSFTGYLTVDKELGNHLFFWFFPSTANKSAPVLLWLNGGPTMPSMMGLFTEHGPMQVAIDPDEDDECEAKNLESPESGYRKRKYSWATPFSMLYVDNPVNVGFSFTESGDKGLRGTKDGYTKDLVSFLEQFYTLFPDLKDRELYLGGQSYAGKYISALGYAIHTRIQEKQTDMNFAGIYLGAPWFDPEVQNLFFPDFLYTMGVISKKGMELAKEQNRHFFAKAKEANESLSGQDFLWEGRFQHLNPIDSYDNYVSGEFTDHRELAELMKYERIKRAAHVGDRNYTTAGEDKSIFEKFDHDCLFVSTKPEMAELMNYYKVLIYNGDYDVIVSTVMLEESLHTTPWKLQSEYNETLRQTWRLNDDRVGFYSKTGNFCRVVIHGAGHQVPHDKPEVAYYMMKQFITDGCVGDLMLPPSSVSSAGKHSFVIDGGLLAFMWIHLLIGKSFLLTNTLP